MLCVFQCNKNGVKINPHTFSIKEEEKKTTPNKTIDKVRRLPEGSRSR